MPFTPFQDAQASLGGLQEEINRLVERVWHAGLSTKPFDGQSWGPAVDLYEYQDHYTMFAEIPGVDAKGVEVTHVGNDLTIRGERRNPAGEGEDIRPIRNERRFGAFCRTVNLPGDIDADRLSAKCADGVLEITIPKSPSSMPKAVRVDVEEG